MRTQYVIVDNGKDYSDNSLDIYRTSLDTDDVLKLLSLWGRAFNYGNTKPGDLWAVPTAVAFTNELYDGGGNLLESPPLKEGYGDINRYKYYFVDRWDDVDGAELSRQIEEIISREKLVKESK